MTDPKTEQELKSALARLTKKLRADAKALRKHRRIVTRIKARRAKLLRWRATRRKQLAKVRDHGRRAVIKHALNTVGQTENPAGSNKGGGIISKCQIELLGSDGYAWCGCFGAWFLKHYGNVQVTSRMAYCPSNVTDAEQAQRTGRPVNGWKGYRVDKTKGEPGDCAMMDWQRDGIADHFVIIVENLGGGAYRTCEGNSSFDNAGSQSNGGAVVTRTRYISDMQMICIPAYRAA